MKNIIILIGLTFCSFAYGQGACSDTIRFNCKEKHFDKYKFNMDEVYYFKGELYFKPSFIVRWFGKPFGSPKGGGDSFCCSKTYYKFYDRNSLIAEGNWCYESFSGLYKRYYDNGTLKAEGMYDTECKVGVWKFYDRDGKFLSEHEYPDKCYSKKGQEYLGDTPPN